MMLFRKLMNKLFGFKYVVFNYGFSSEVRRVRLSPDGQEYVVCYGDFLFIDTPDKSYHKFKRII